MYTLTESHLSVSLSSPFYLYQDNQNIQGTIAKIAKTEPGMDCSFRSNLNQPWTSKVCHK